MSHRRVSASGHMQGMRLGWRAWYDSPEPSAPIPLRVTAPPRASQRARASSRALAGRAGWMQGQATASPPDAVGDLADQAELVLRASSLLWLPGPAEANPHC